MEMNMSMCLFWSYECYFIFEQLESKTVDMFILGCAVCLVFAFLSMGSKKIKNFIISKFSKNAFQYIPFDSERLNSIEQSNQQKNKKGSVLLKILLFFYYLYYSIVHMIIMLLIMTMNVYVILAIIIGLTLGYVVFEQDVEKDTGNQDLPVNCGCQ